MNSCSVSSRIDLNICQISGFKIDIVADILINQAECDKVRAITESLSILYCIYVDRYTKYTHIHTWKAIYAYLSKDSMGAIFLNFSIIVPTNIPKNYSSL